MKNHERTTTFYECEICGTEYDSDEKGSKGYNDCAANATNLPKSSFTINQIVEFWTDRGGKARLQKAQITELYYSKPGEEIVLAKECYPQTHTPCVTMNIFENSEKDVYHNHGIDWITEQELLTRMNKDKQWLIHTGYLAQPFSFHAFAVLAVVIIAIVIIIYCIGVNH